MADDVVRDIPEEIVEDGARGVVGTVFTKAFEDSHSKHIDLARAVLSAALAGRQVVDTQDDGHCSKCGQPFSDEVREVVLEPRLPFDARDRVERVLRGSGHDPSTAVQRGIRDYARAYWIPANFLCGGDLEARDRMATNWAKIGAPFITACIQEDLRKAAAGEG